MMRLVETNDSAHAFEAALLAGKWYLDQKKYKDMDKILKCYQFILIDTECTSATEKQMAEAALFFQEHIGDLFRVYLKTPEGKMYHGSRALRTIRKIFEISAKKELVRDDAYYPFKLTVDLILAKDYFLSKIIIIPVSLAFDAMAVPFFPFYMFEEQCLNKDQKKILAEMSDISSKSLKEKLAEEKRLAEEKKRLAEEKRINSPEFKFPFAKICKSSIPLYKTCVSGTSFQWFVQQKIIQLESDTYLGGSWPSPDFLHSYELSRNGRIDDWPVCLIFAFPPKGKKQEAVLVRVMFYVPDTKIDDCAKKYSEQYPNAKVEKGLISFDSGSFGSIPRMYPYTTISSDEIKISLKKFYSDRIEVAVEDISLAKKFKELEEREKAEIKKEEERQKEIIRKKALGF